MYPVRVVLHVFREEERAEKGLTPEGFGAWSVFPARKLAAGEAWCSGNDLIFSNFMKDFFRCSPIQNPGKIHGLQECMSLFGEWLVCTVYRC